MTALRFRGADVTDTQTFTVALDNFRAGGTDGYDMFRRGEVLWRSPDGVRDYLVTYVMAHPGLDPSTTGGCNFSVAPDLYGHQSVSHPASVHPGADPRRAAASGLLARPQAWLRSPSLRHSRLFPGWTEGG